MGAPVEYPQRIAMVSLHTSPLATPGVGDAGGLNVYVDEVARRLGERGVAVDVFTRAEDDGPEVVEVNEHTRVVQVPAGPREPVAKEDLPALLPDFASALAERLDGHDLLHSHYWLSGQVAMAVAAGRGLPLVHTMHTMARVKNSALGAGQSGEPDVRERGEAEVVAAADVLTANTSEESAELQRHYGADPAAIAVVPPGVDLHTFHACNQPASRAQLTVGADRQVVLFVGRIQPLKAPDVVIRAVAELVRRDPGRRERLRLIVVGSPSGPQAAWARSLGPLAAELGVADLVELRPHSPRAELFRWYCASDVVAVPSYNESFGLVALEAQACGRPVVATDVGGLRHAVRDGQTGLLVAGHEPAAWADALATLLDDAGERGRMGANAAGHASRFSWDNTAAATLEAYHAARVRHAARG
ncbi:D-inositol-3-phosphate glycosyltransferase [Microlunatus capsulatus]|uniref:D-inositol-3-phosphate glycosyltransferase n=1 Tax=Microlunatus capsulatus TaxID=99117 RepID=A0ABS4ZB35_9ACTN|nr:D-inositol-3-phosphate glycosyltransferase [Microlunatus capsulatus]MBP2418271.1 D-inositol-3-phosphate glycosyltransferase [Microlunatus capsulatus]